MITFVTIVLDGEPWIERHYPVFQTLTVPWRWIVVEGVAANVNCTSWCASMAPRLSNDGTTDYLIDLAKKDYRVHHTPAAFWRGGKVEMCNWALGLIAQPCLLWQVDADEIWTKEQIEAVVATIHYNPHHNAAQFMCRFFVGTDRYIRPTPNVYGNHVDYEWRRVWRFEPGMRFKTHEPPVIDGLNVTPLSYHFFPMFDHMAYATRAQMEFRAKYYAGTTNPNAHLWRNCVVGWERLQTAELPCKLKDYLPWVDDKAIVIGV